MRELKYRAWNKDKKIMHYDFQFVKRGSKVGEFILFISEDIKAMEIMQYTGLKDSNGNEIYDQDIVEWGDGKEKIKMIVEWHRGGFSFIIINDPYGVWQKVDMEVADEVKIIGNSFENPELEEKTR